MKTIKGLFFDLDGTLANTLEANSKAYQQAVKEIGREFTHEMYASTYGMRVDAFLKKFFPDITDEEINQVRKIKAKIYPSLAHLAKPNKELIGFIKTLRASHTTALVTMANRPNAEAIVNALKLSELFDFIITGDEVDSPKPNPECYLKALDVTGLNASEVLAFEDSETGINAAKAAGILTLTINISGDKNEN